MPSRIDEAFGIHARALQLYAQRTQTLASNLANADTPGYKARDIDFKAALNDAMGSQLAVRKTSGGHIGLSGDGASRAQTLYRVPLQASADGNTVDTQIEQSQFAQNAVRHQASVTFLNGTIKGLLTAIRGE